MSLMTPSRLEVLLHCYVNPCVHPRMDAPAVQEDIRVLKSHGLIRPYDRTFEVTEKGEFYVKHLLSIPFPETTFVIPEVK